MTFRRDALPRATAALWEILEKEPLLKGFSLVGGTALALRIAHRQSEDLDFVCVSEKLPVHRVDGLVRKIRTRGLPIQPLRDVAEEQSFLNDGMELADYQQNYVIGGVKLSLFTADPELRAVLLVEPSAEDGPVVPSLECLFASKALVCSHRSKSRDWLDMYVLCTQHGFRVADIYRVFEQYDRYGWDSAIARLTTMVVPADDEGYLHLMGSPPSIETMRAFFAKERVALERDLARPRGGEPNSAATGAPTVRTDAGG